MEQGRRICLRVDSLVGYQVLFFSLGRLFCIPAVFLFDGV
jgi:hypothetical protein